ncbi:hypothetical protein Cgig2_030651 [Carnegiea gigantea]|uniref:C3H1-type domain-containing protein n=1 Tax=Carnegiea gigantea TaxID=171969 RepID=A0A9Q1K2V7_9CARY|nr:hypothetical protein Cgig2_030651 [Carnegiea gigantea]
MNHIHPENDDSLKDQSVHEEDLYRSSLGMYDCIVYPSQDVEAKGDEVSSQPGASAAVKPEASIPSDVHAMGVMGSCCTSSSPGRQSRKGKDSSVLGGRSSKSPKFDLAGPDSGIGKDTRGLVGSRISVDVSENIKSADIKETELHSIKAADIEETNLPSLLNKGDSPAARPKSDLVDEANHDMQLRKDVDQKASRFSRSCASQVKRRRLSPGVNYDNGNKRPAVICEYFAKGWCIKGSLCRFLHKREHVDSDRQEAEGDTLSTKSELRADEGSGDKADCSKWPLHNQLGVVVGSVDDLLASSTGKNILQDGESLNGNPCNEADKSASREREVSSSLLSAESQKSPSSEDASRSFPWQRGVEVDIFKGNLSSNHHSVAGGGVQQHSSSFPGYGSLPREVEVASGSNLKSRFSSYSLQESAAMGMHYSSDGHNLPGYGSPRDIDLNSSVPVSSNMPSYQASGWKANSSSYTSLKEDACGAHYSLSCDREDGAFVNHSRDLLASSKYKTRFTPYNWETSVPFRPSFFIPSLGASSSDIPYDPIRDSLEQPDLGSVSFRHSSYNHGSMIPDSLCIPERNSVESHKKLHSDTWDKNYCDHNKDVPVVEAESAATSASDVQNKNISEDEDSVVPASVKDVLKASRGIADGNSVLQGDGGKQKEVGVQKGRETNELDEEEAKAIKYFRAALIDFVKELMKPIWHEGRLSKDVYKVIVQKAEDKILSSLQTNQVPNTSESIKQYLSSSRFKILKLIQAYVDKYGKF